MNIIGIPVIVGIIYIIIELLKMTFKNEKLKNFLPIIAASIGAILGIIAYFFIPDIMPVSNPYTAILLGLCSGLSATGTNQVIKQLLKLNALTQSQKANNQNNNKEKKDNE